VTRYLSPLRYPGGKSSLAGFIGDLIDSQPNRPRRYVEPFAGGAGVALRMLISERAESVVLNDLEPGIAAFWRSVFFDTAALARRVRTCHPSIAIWHRQHSIYTSRQGGDLALGFATFFLNRTNRSGILLDARPIGGLRQLGKWRIDARYDGECLAKRIELIGRYRSRVTVLERDGVAVAREHIGGPDTFVYLDPPYLHKGAELYLDTLTMSDHGRLARLIADRPGWALTYDVDSRVRDLYPHNRRAVFSIPHTAGPRHLGSEYAIFAHGLVVPPLRRLGTKARFAPDHAPLRGRFVGDRSIARQVA
jgi:DNA adenine methylase